MRVRTHLIAMPWAPPDAPSIQLACLKAHLDRSLPGRSDCRTYSAFFSILHALQGHRFLEFFQAMDDYREYVYLTLYLRRFGPSALRRRRAVGRLRKALYVRGARPLSLSLLDGLETATRRYLEHHVVPALIGNGVNIVGFTLNFHQVYASLYAAEYLRRRLPNRHFLFVYGGSCASLPTVYQLLTELRLPGVVVVGEGERKLEGLVRTVAELPLAEASSVLEAVAGRDPGVVVIGEPVDFGVADPARHASQLPDLGELPLPHYDEYFEALRRACANRAAFVAFRTHTSVPVEGSRGCFAKCDFCSLNQVWSGFRRRSAEQVLASTLALTRKYRTSHVTFVDNVCDTWATPYAHYLVAHGIRQQLFMELRAHHPERFWTELALAGLDSVQVGVEAISGPLLKAIGKGTKVFQNLAAHKYLTELGVWPSNNLMTHHPASTLADVRETRRILRQIPHWGRFLADRFLLMPGSPLHEGLSEDERAALKPTRTFRLPEGAARYALEYTYELPRRLRPSRGVLRAWDVFIRQYRRTVARLEVEQPRLDIVRVDADTLRITDTRAGKQRVTALSGAAARVYDACHAGLSSAEIARTTALPAALVETQLARFVRAMLVLHVDGRYLALALRPRDELVRRFLQHASPLQQLEPLQTNAIWKAPRAIAVDV